MYIVFNNVIFSLYSRKGTKSPTIFLVGTLGANPSRPVSGDKECNLKIILEMD